MAEELDWVYYDVVASSTTASATKTFFAHTEAANTHYVTNMPVAGRLLDSEEFEVKEISFWYDTDMLQEDIVKLYDRCSFEFLIGRNRVLCLPAVMCAPKNEIKVCQGPEDAAALTQIAGAAGGPFKLRIPIKIPRGSRFAVEVKLGHGATPTDTNMICALRGILRRR